MASSSIQNLNQINPIYLICPICHCSLVEELSRKKEVVRAFCSHVFHEVCLTKAYQVRNHGKQRADYEYVCPLCFQVSKTENSMKILLEPIIDQDQMNRIEETKDLCVKNQKLTRNLNVAELRLLVLRGDICQLRRKVEKLKWDDLTNSFQSELVKKLESSCDSLNITNVCLSFLSPETIFELIDPGFDKKTLIIKFTQDLFKHKASWIGSLTLDNFKDFFKYNLVDLFLTKCKISSLNLEQLPVTPQILQLLFSVEEKVFTKNRDFTINLLETYLHDYSNRHVKNLIKILLVKLISELLHCKIEIQTLFVPQSVLAFFKKTGILKKEKGVYDFTHASVKFYLVGLLTFLIRKKLNLPYIIARECFYKGRVAFGTLEHYFIEYLNGWSHFKNDFVKLMESDYDKIFTFTNTQNLDLLVLLTVLKLQGTDNLALVLCNFERLYTIDMRNMWEVRYPCRFDAGIEYLSLPQFAAIRGNLAVMKKMYHLFDASKRDKYFDFRTLVHLCGYCTIEKNAGEIFERTKLVSFVLSLNKSRPSLNHDEPQNNCLTVHVGILKAVVQIGIEYFRNIWNTQHIINMVKPRINQDHLHIFMYYFLEQPEMMRMLDMYASTRPVAV